MTEDERSLSQKMLELAQAVELRRQQLRDDMEVGAIRSMMHGPAWASPDRSTEDEIREKLHLRRKDE
jgi:hypothetical protein